MLIVCVVYIIFVVIVNYFCLSVVVCSTTSTCVACTHVHVMCSMYTLFFLVISSTTSVTCMYYILYTYVHTCYYLFGTCMNNLLFC